MIRTTWGQLVLRILPVVAVFAALSLLGVAIGEGASGWDPLVGVVIGLVFALPLGRRMRVVLDERCLVFVNWSRSEIPWRQVQGVAPPARGWFRIRCVTVHDGYGWRRLMALGAGWPWERERADRQYHQVGQWWLAHRGDDWQPAPPPRAGASGVP